MDATKTYPQFILLGDSLVQYSSSVTYHGYPFSAGLAEQCIRRLDVVNRGFSGYNTSQILKIFEHLIPHPSSAKVEYLLILLGANDSCLPDSPTRQHIPLKEYRENLKTMITHPLVAAQNPTILLVTPPPINEVHLESEDLKKGHPAVTRHQSVTAQYAEAVRELATELKSQKVVLVDLWAALMKEGLQRTLSQPKQGSLLVSREDGDSTGLRELFVDGLHFSALAYEVFLGTLLPLLKPNETQGHDEALPWVFPSWTVAPYSN